MLRAGDGHALFTLGQVASVAGGRLLCGSPSTGATGVAVDTRAVRPGDLFCAVRGERVDAHDLLPEAVRAGAAAVLVDRDPGDHFDLRQIPEGVGLVRVPAVLPAIGRLGRWHLDHSAPRLCVLGVTGSVGKTGTRRLLSRALEASGLPVLSPEASFNTEITVPLVCLRARPEHRFAAMELGMRGPGQIRYLAEICRPEIGLLTVIGESHLEALGSVEAIVEAKGELVTAIPPGGTVILNRDDPRQAVLAARASARVLWYGTDPSSDVVAQEVRPLDGPQGGWSFFAAFGALGRRVPVRLRLLGRHQVGNALGALCAAVVAGVEPEAAAAALEGVAPAEGRLVLRACGPVRVLDDAYNASPHSVRAALEVLGELEPDPGARGLVLGDMLELGAAAPALHREVGQAAGRLGAAFVVTVGALASEIASGAIEAGLAPSRVQPVLSRAEARRLLPSLLTPGMTVLIKGSRAVGLEEVVEAIVDWSRQSSDGEGRPL